MTHNKMFKPWCVCGVETDPTMFPINSENLVRSVYKQPLRIPGFTCESKNCHYFVH